MHHFKHDLRDPAVKHAMQMIEFCGLSLKIKPACVEVYAQNGMSLIALSTKAQILHFARELAAAPNTTPPDDPLARRLDDLEAKLLHERAQHKALVAQHAALQSRLAATEQHLRTALTADPRRYTKLKTFLAKEFHPDNFHGPALEKRYCTEFFKLIWTCIEAIEKS